MAGFLIPFGQALEEFGTGIVQGGQVREQNLAQRLSNQYNALQIRQQISDMAAKKQLMDQAKADPRFNNDPLFMYALQTGDKGVLQYLAKQGASGQKVHELMVEADVAEAGGDTQRANQLRQFARYLSAGFGESTGGRMSGAVQDPMQAFGQALGNELKGGQLKKQADEEAQRQQAAAEGAHYGVGGGPPPSALMPNITPPGRGMLPTPSPAYMEALRKRDPEATAIYENLIKSGAPPSGGFPSTDTPPGMSPVSAAAPATPTPAATPAPKPVNIQDVPMEEVLKAEGSLNKGVQKLALGEERRRRALQPDAKEKTFLAQVSGAQKAARDLEVDVQRLGRYNPGIVFAMARKANIGGYGLPKPWEDYFRDMGAVYNALFQAGKGTGSGGGLGLLRELDIHFPHGANRLFPDDPKYALSKVKGLLISPAVAPILAQRDYILKRQWEAEHGKASTYLSPESLEVLHKAGVPGY